MTLPNFAFGVISQKHWRQVGDIDDCVVCADLMCVHSVASWLPLVGTTEYRAKAGNPDDPSTGDGLSVDQSAKAIHALYPHLAIEVVKGGAWAPFAAKVKAGHPASLCVFGASFATKNGAPVRHRGALTWTSHGEFKFYNPIKDPYTIPGGITEAAIKKGAVDYPDAGDVYAIIFPTIEQAFKTHPLYAAPTAPVDDTASFNAGVTAAASAALTAKR